MKPAKATKKPFPSLVRPAALRVSEAKDERKERKTAKKKKKRKTVEEEEEKTARQGTSQSPATVCVFCPSFAVSSCLLKYERRRGTPERARLATLLADPPWH